MADKNLSSFLAIRPISAEETAPLRHLVLWPSITLGSQLDRAYDFNPGTVHLGAFLILAPGWVSMPAEYLPSSTQQVPIGILTLAVQPYAGSSALCPCTPEHPLIHIQLHKFAVHPSLRGLGAGRTMLVQVIKLLQERYGKERVLLHLDARANQTKFYKLCGMEILDPKEFEKRGTTGNEAPIVHIKMGKVI
ncbi:hypothetical protein L204_104855 [Cryptococcus depauperatus]|nr:hypothetical protein L204_05365 [Cryptococcus depauperatus CBS 7855]